MKHKIEIYADKTAMSAAAAALFQQLAQATVAANGRFLVALSGGSTPQALFSRLASEPYTANIPWADVHFFWGDERLVPANDPGSNYYHAQQLLFDHVPIPAINVHRVKGKMVVDIAVEEYREQLSNFAGPDRQWPRFDLTLLGLGSDGHTASLFPGSPPKEVPGLAVKAVTADYQGRPAERVTLTPAVFNDSRHVIFLVAGADKAEALAAVLNGPQDEQKWPAQRIEPHSGTLTWIVDAEAARLLTKDEWPITKDLDG